MPSFFSSLKGPRANREDLANSSTSSSQPPPYAPSEVNDAPPYHNWHSVPDTALLPPPPAMLNDYSTTTNASYDSAAEAHKWCAKHPVYQPTVPNAVIVQHVIEGKVAMNPPARGFKGELRQIETPSADIFARMPSTVYHLRSSTIATSKPKTNPFSFSQAHAAIPEDQIFLSALPLYFAALNNPFSPNFGSEKADPFTTYFEIIPRSFNSKDATIAIGFAAKPYPSWRQPGWQRASIGVHSDDGRRYVNDPWGGTDFVAPFNTGDVIGLAIKFYPEHIMSEDSKDPQALPNTSSAKEVQSSFTKVRTRAFFMRNGALEGSWDIGEERDADQDGGIEGLQGQVDLYAAVGTFGDVELEIRFFAQDELPHLVAE